MDFYAIASWIINHRVNRDFNQEINERLSLNQLYDEFRNTFPNSIDLLDFETARNLDEQLCGIQKCGNFWRQAYDFPGESGSIKFDNHSNQLIRVISTGIFTFNFEIINQLDENDSPNS